MLSAQTKERREQEVGPLCIKKSVPFVARETEIPDSRRMNMWDDSELVS